MSGSKRAPSRRRPAVTIQQVADAAGVSMATASRALSQVETVHPELAERVRRTARELDYRPNAAAQRLATGVTRTVGVVVPNLANPYFYDVLKAMNTAANSDGYRMLVADADEDPEEELALGRTLLPQVDALILVSPRAGIDTLREFEGASAQVVLVNRAPVGVGLPSVSVDNYAAMLDLAGHLVRLGHRDVVYLAGPPRSWQNRERWRAISDAASFGLRATACRAGAAIEEGYAAVPGALEHRPSALICHNDLVAVGALARLAELGIDVPGQMSVTGFDDIAFARYTSPPLTTARSPQRELGLAAWTLVSGLLRDERPAPPPLLKAPLVTRGSTAAPASAASSFEV